MSTLTPEGIAAKKLENLTQKVRRYIAAHNAFDQVARTLKSLPSDDLEQHSPLYDTIFCGVCVTYVAPFLDATGIGKLSAKFTKFEGMPEFQQTHDSLMASRHSMLAHHSPVEIEQMILKELPGPLDPMQLVVIGPGKFEFSAPRLVWRKDRLRAIEDLSRFQANRVALEMDETFKELEAMRGKPYGPGTYTVGVDFP